jgi:hypothetical protein
MSSSRFYDTSTKKSVHISMPTGTHRIFKTETASRGLSMQEVYEELATRLAEGDAYMTKLLDHMEAAKREGRKIKRLVKEEEQDFYDLLEADDPLKE